MVKISLIGAGSVVFTRNLSSDILLTPVLEGCTISLMDIDPGRLERARGLVQGLIDRHGSKVQLEVTTDRRESIRDAGYVITTFQQGGLDAFKTDIEIPQKYGVEQAIGDTLGPGGVFRALRTIPVMTGICNDMDELAPDALLLNYVNPMAAVCWAIDALSGRPVVGLCHSVQQSSELLADWAGVPYERFSYLCAGLNHHAFFLTLTENTPHGRVDAYPRVWETIKKQEALDREPVRIEIMKHFGYFCTEASGHNSEYLPYFRKNAKAVEDLVPFFKYPPDHYWFDYGRTGGYLRHCYENEANASHEYQDLISGKVPLPAARSEEYGADVIEAMETNRPIMINGNVPNTGLIDNLPEGCCVEVPCLVDGNGVQGTFVGSLPPQIAALLRTNVNVQELIVHAALTCDVDAVYHAVMLDPLTGAVCTLPQIHAMVTEMLAAQKQWLPQFAI
jgi:alpha-galactosidase